MNMYKKENKYYKIVTDQSAFTERYGAYKSIPYGTRFSDSFDNIIVSKVGEWVFVDCISSACWLGPNIFHFCKGAFETMLWHNVLFRWDNLWFRIYEIVPLDTSPIFEGKSRDRYGFFQHGATEIEFRKQVPIDDIYDAALQEYYDFPQEKAKMYPGLQMAQVIDACEKHKHFLPRITPWERERFYYSVHSY